MRPRGVQLPAWLETFIQESAECFEPQRESARAGYVCTCADDGWRVQMFLGMTELVGGSADGANILTAFGFDLERARDCFEAINEITWHAALADSEASIDGDSDARVVITGAVAGQAVSLEILLNPPTEMGPGLLKYLDGRCELV